jgi:hypothetical protein
MQQALYRSSLVPHGFVVESAYYEGDKAVIAILRCEDLPALAPFGRPQGFVDCTVDMLALEHDVRRDEMRGEDKEDWAAV